MSRVPARNPRNLRVGPWSIMFLLASQMNTGATFRSLTTGSADVSAKQHVTGICCRLKVVCYAPHIGTIDRLLTLRTTAVVVEVVVGFSPSVALPLPLSSFASSLGFSTSKLPSSCFFLERGMGICAEKWAIRHFEVQAAVAPAFPCSPLPPQLRGSTALKNRASKWPGPSSPLGRNGNLLCTSS